MINAAAKTVRNDVVALIETMQKALYNLNGHNCMPCAEPRK